MEDKNNLGPQAFFFGPEVFAGKGKVKKGIILAILRSVPILGWVGVPIYSAIKAKKELEGEVPFNWKVMIGVMILDIFLLKLVAAFLPK